VRCLAATDWNGTSGMFGIERRKFCRPFGAYFLGRPSYQGLTPLAINDRRVAAWGNRTLARSG
jgi:hypothetical protein